MGHIWIGRFCSDIKNEQITIIQSSTWALCVQFESLSMYDVTTYVIDS